ncbi:MAG: transketolase [Phycisphaerae bacterium]|nr:transketolase [Phycisphaerae bacterium]MDD5381156.1 transketolase [Phycisphaerae bacterium]
MAISAKEIKELEKAAKRLRYDIVMMIGTGKPGHLGGSCSIADIVAVFYFHKMRHNPKEPKFPDRDRFVLSKGHAALAQYAALAECGYFPKKELSTLKELGTIVQGHPEMRRMPGIEAYTGSLGQGLSVACGMAMAGKIDKKNYKVYCIVGDGEIAEGQIWEASMTAAFYKLDNLVAIFDKNLVQATGPIVERYDTNPHVEKWKAFGWEVFEIDGHDIKQIADALDDADKVKDKPVMIVARTIKSKGVPFAEGKAEFHHGIMTEEQHKTARQLFEE